MSNRYFHRRPMTTNMFWFLISIFSHGRIVNQISYNTIKDNNLYWIPTCEIYYSFQENNGLFNNIMNLNISLFRQSRENKIMLYTVQCAVHTNKYLPNLNKYFHNLAFHIVYNKKNGSPRTGTPSRRTWGGWR